jgi:diguanylate cyclase (GGDEF)-like protein
LKIVPAGRVVIFCLLALILAALFIHFGFKCEKAYLIPLILFAYFLATYFDVPLPGLGHVNSDHAVAFPAVLLLGNPFLAGLLNGLGYIFERTFRYGVKGLSQSHWLSFFITSVNTSIAAFLFQALGGFAEGSSLARSFTSLLLSLLVFAVVGFIILLADRIATKTAFSIKVWTGYLLKYIAFLFISSPFLGIFLLAISEKHIPFLILSLFPLVSTMWSLRVNFKLMEKNNSLIQSTQKQEFLQQIMLNETGTLDDQDFLKNLLLGLKDFIKWDKDILFLASLDLEKEPIIFSTGEFPSDPHRVIGTLEDILQANPPLKAPICYSNVKFAPLLDARSKSQLIIPLSTEQISFGILVLERISGPPFDTSEVQLGYSAFSQVARHIQDKILKGQLLATNQTLLKQTHYLSEILKISNLLKIHLSSQEILEEVATGISQSLGFKTVLISLYRHDEKCFERIAHAGLDEKWKEISEKKPPEENILRHFKEEFRIGSCYLVRNITPTPFTIMPKIDEPTVSSPDDWVSDDALFVPLLTSNNHLLGIISVDEPRDGKIPSLETLNALEILANQAVHAFESAEIHAVARHDAVMDGLTNLYNHRHFQESLSRVIRQSVISNSTFSLLMMDLDNFKETNDSFGHLAGDAVLRSVGQTLLEVTRKDDIAARYGGEEFAVLLNGLDSNQARMVAERIRTLVEKKPVYDDSIPHPIKITISIGIATFPKHSKSHKELLNIADLALYRAKQAGKNRIAEGP